MTAPAVVEAAPTSVQKMTSNKGSNDAAPPANVRVVGRIRPMAKYELENGSKQVITSLPNDSNSEGAATEPEVLQVKPANAEKRWFELDAVFDQTSTQKEVYIKSGAQQAVCHDIFKGFNCTILAYGQTGSGKTFTMGTAIDGNDVSENDGVIPRACADLYLTIQDKCDGNAQVELSYLEVYNEEIRDLLTANEADHAALRIRENMNGEIYVRGLQSQVVSNSAEIGVLMEQASKRRVVASTKMNATSSRSHAICVLRIKGVLEDDTKFEAKLTLVDLAGSERIKKTGAGAKRAQEGININKGLFVLGQVVSALSEQRPKFKRKPPYRDSKLTRLLQDSLGGNSRTIMVACVSPADYNLDETTNTLRYATSARNIKNTATRNVVKTMSPEEAAKLRRENELLKSQVVALQQTIGEMEKQLLSMPEVSDDEFEEDDDDDNVSMQLEEIKEDAKSTERIHDLEREVKSLKRDLRRANGGIRESLHETAIELPAIKVQMAMLEDELQESQSINVEVDELHQELEEAKAEASAAKAAAKKLTQIIERHDESDTRLSMSGNNHANIDDIMTSFEMDWVQFVCTVMGSFQENMRQLGDYFDMVSKIVDSPDIAKMIPRSSQQQQGQGRKRWWGSGVVANQEVDGLKEEMELRQKLLTEHISFYQEQFLEIEDRITNRSEVLDSILDSLRQGKPRELGLIQELTAILIDPSKRK